MRGYAIRCALFSSLVAACGSSGNGGLFANSTTQQGSGGATESASGGAPNGSGGVVLATSGGFGGSGAFGGNLPIIPGTGGATGDGGDAAIPLGTGGVTDAGENAGGASAGGAADVGSSPPAPGANVGCNGPSCTTDTGGACCFAVSGGGKDGNQTTATCISGTAPCGFPYTAAHCDGPEDCGPGTVCCGTFQSIVGVPFFTNLGCTAASACAGDGRAVMCHPGNAASGCAPPAKCGGALTLLGGYGTCQ